MGCQESSEFIAEEKEQNKAIESELKKTKRELNAQTKLLLLGTGESGKSTIAKQMKILHRNGFTEEEIIGHRHNLYNNLVESMKILIRALPKFNLSLPESLLPNARRIEALNSMDLKINQQVADDITALWNDRAIKQAYDRRNELQIVEDAPFFFQNVQKYVDPNYMPDTQTILRVRGRTTGIVETTFDYKDSKFKLIDVGGQRSERKKWLHCFEDVTAIIYCIALNEYDMKLYEDETVNRMIESLELFEEIVNSKWFTKTAVILFLNKSDLFREKLNRVDLSTLFPEYKGGRDFDKAVKFIQQKYIETYKDLQHKQIYAHVTCALDTENIRVVFDATREIIVTQGLEAMQLM